MVDKKQSEREFEEGDEVHLRLNHPHLKALFHQPISKMSPKLYGLYPIITKIGKVASKLQLPEGTHIHLVFHVSLLKKSIGNNVPAKHFPLTSVKK